MRASCTHRRRRLSTSHGPPSSMNSSGAGRAIPPANGWRKKVENWDSQKTVDFTEQGTIPEGASCRSTVRLPIIRAVCWHIQGCCACAVCHSSVGIYGQCRVSELWTRCTILLATVVAGGVVLALQVWGARAIAGVRQRAGKLGRIAGHRSIRDVSGGQSAWRSVEQPGRAAGYGDTPCHWRSPPSIWWFFRSHTARY